jgi:hypothetical protein
MRHLLAPVAAAIAVMSALPASASTIDLSSLDLNGSATMVGGSLQLTSTTSQAGSAWVNDAISTTTSFSSTFDFSLKGYTSGSMADGIGLVFQNVGTTATGNGGGDIGYWNLGGKGAVGTGSLIQSWTNNTAGLSTNGVVQGLKAAPFNLGAANDVTGTETVSYNAATHELTMTGTFLDVATGVSYAVSDAAAVNLDAKYGSTMYIGFVGGTGGAGADQRITSFSVSAVPEPESYAMLLAGLGLIGFIARRRKIYIVLPDLADGGPSGAERHGDRGNLRNQPGQLVEKFLGRVDRIGRHAHGRLDIVDIGRGFRHQPGRAAAGRRVVDVGTGKDEKNGRVQQRKHEQQDRQPRAHGPAQADVLHLAQVPVGRTQAFPDATDGGEDQRIGRGVLLRRQHLPEVVRHVDDAGAGDGGERLAHGIVEDGGRVAAQRPDLTIRADIDGGDLCRGRLQRAQGAVAPARGGGQAVQDGDRLLQVRSKLVLQCQHGRHGVSPGSFMNEKRCAAFSAALIIVGTWWPVP